MPVAVKFSREACERLGDKAVNELVELVDTVDARSQVQLRELDEQNVARFEAMLEQRLSELRAELDRRSGSARRQRWPD